MVAGRASPGLCVVAVAWSLFVSRDAFAELADRHDFDGPGTSWRLLQSQTRSEIISQACVAGGARDDAGAERVVAAAARGDSVLLGCATKRVAVLPELQIRLWVKSNRSSIQLAARASLPRALDPDNGLSRTVLVRGDRYNRPGQWQQLTLSAIPKLLGDQVRVMRATSRTSIDAREAFIDSVVLVVPGDPQGVEVLTDALEVDGIVLPQAEEIQQASYPAIPAPASAAPASADETVRLQGGLLLVNERPFLPRIIEWQGEPLALLAERGFNTLQLRHPPSSELVAEARQHGLWFVCIPPRPEALAGEASGGSADRVLAWLLDDEALGDDPGYARRWSELIRQRDSTGGRPVILDAALDRSITDKSADILVARFPHLQKSESDDLERWLEQRLGIAGRGMPTWTAFRTQFGDTVAEQAVALSSTSTTLAPPIADLDELESLVESAAARGVRGFFFQSESSLTESDRATRIRAAVLERINRKLELVEPWLAGGQVIGHMHSSDPGWTGVEFQVDRARLVVPLRLTARTEPAGTPSSAVAPSPTEIAFVVPGIPESSQAYALSPAGMRMLSLHRLAGGTRLSLPATGDVVALITEDSRVVQSFRQRVLRDGPKLVRLERDLIADRAKHLVDTGGRLAQLGYSQTAASRDIATVNASLGQLDAHLTAGRLEQALAIATSADRILAQCANEQRRRVGIPPRLTSNPLALSYEHLGEYAALEQALAELRRGENLLYEGDFEDLAQMLQFGWRHIHRPQPGDESRVELSAVEPKYGRYCLALHSVAATKPAEPVALTAAREWVVSPPVALRDGQIVEISGWVRIDEPIGGAGQGFYIVESLGGPELALRVRHTKGWEPFRMLRAAVDDSELRLSFALAGSGLAQVDAVMIRALSHPDADDPPSTMPPKPAQESDLVERPGPLLTVPQTR